MAKIRKNDQVMIITGKDKGKVGRVIEVMGEEDKVIIEGLNLVKKAYRRKRQEDKGGIIDIEAPIHVSNIMLVDKKTNKPTRIAMKVLKDGKKIRIGKKTGEEI